MLMDINKKEFHIKNKENSDETKDAVSKSNVVQCKSQLNYLDSDDMFSEEEQCEIGKFTPSEKKRNKNPTNCNNSINLDNGYVEENSKKPFVPHTPITLQPLIHKCSQTWNSDMETPIHDKLSTITSSATIHETIQENSESIIVEEDTHICSPIFINKKRRRAKRRIFKSSNTSYNTSDLILEPLVHNTSSTSSSFNTSNSVENIKDLNNTLDNESENKNINTNDCKLINSKINNTQSKIQESMNLSSQDFFNNASFSMIDKICTDHAEILQTKVNKSETHNTEKSTIELLQLCREQIKQRNSTIVEPNNIIPSQIMNESAEEELHSIQVKNSKQSLSNLPSGVTATELFNIINESNSSKTDQFKKPNATLETSYENMSKSTIEQKTQNTNLNTTCSETQLMTCCDLAEFMQDSNEWSESISCNESNEKIKINMILNNKQNYLAATHNLHDMSKIKNNQETITNEIKVPERKDVYEQCTIVSKNNYDLEPNVSVLKSSREKSLKSEATYKKDSASTKIISGFKNARGDNIFIDKDKLSQAKQLYEEDPECTISSDNKYVPNTDYDYSFINKEGMSKPKISHQENFESKTVNTGFTTASGKAISINTDNLCKAQKLYEEDAEPKISFNFNSINEDNIPKSNIEKEVVCKTKAYKTSDESTSKDILLNAKQMNEHNSKPKSSSTMISDFKTISSKETPVPKAFLTVNTGFKTAGGGNISINKDNLLKAKQLYEDDSELKSSSNTHSEVRNENSKKKSVSKTTLTVNTGFKMAGGGNILINKDNLLKARQLYEDDSELKCKSTMNSDYKKTCSEEMHVPKVFSPVNTGFKTAGGGNISINKDNLLKAKQLYENDSELNSFSKTDSEQITENFKGKSVLKAALIVNTGFKTAGGGKISINKDNLLKAKQLYEEDSELKSSSNKNSDLKTVSFKEITATKAITVNTGFKTAGGGNISINKDTLVKAKQLYEEDSELNISSNKKSALTIESSIKTSVSKAALTVNTGFKTAGGGNILINKDNFLKAKQLYEDDSESKSSSDINSDFRPGYINKTSINKDTLSKAKHWNQENYEPKTPSTINSGVDVKEIKTIKKDNSILGLIYKSNDSSVKIMSGFKTAKGENIFINKDQLSQATKLYEDEFEQNMSLDINSATPKCSNVSINRNKLSEANQLYKENFKPETCLTINSGFKTASGENIAINKDNLLKAKELYEDDSEPKSVSSKRTNNDNVIINEYSSLKKRKLANTNVGFKSTSLIPSKIKNMNIKSQEISQRITESTANKNILLNIQDMFGEDLNLNELDNNIVSLQGISSSFPIKPLKNVHLSLDSTKCVTRSNSELIMSTYNKKNDRNNGQSYFPSNSLQQGHKRKWLSDSDIRCNLTKSISGSQEIENRISDGFRKKLKSTESSSNLKKSISVDNCFDLATDFIMSNLQIGDLFESSGKENYLPKEKVNRFVTYPSDENVTNITPKIINKLSLSESNLRKRAIKNSTFVMKQLLENKENFYGFSQDEILKSKFIHDKMDSILQNYIECSSCSISLDMVNEISVNSSQLQIKNSLNTNDVYFTQPSDMSPCQFSKSSSSECEQLSHINFDDNYDKKKLIAGANIIRTNDLPGHIASPSSPPFLGFSPPDDHPVTVLTSIIKNLNKYKFKNSDKDAYFNKNPTINVRDKSIVTDFKQLIDNEELSMEVCRESNDHKITSKESLEQITPIFTLEAENVNLNNIIPKIYFKPSNIPPLSSEFKNYCNENINIVDGSLKKANHILNYENLENSNISIEHNQAFKSNISSNFHVKKTANFSVADTLNSICSEKIEVKEFVTSGIDKSLNIIPQIKNLPTLRKVNSIDNNTPSGRYQLIGLKKPRISMELQARKLFDCDNSYNVSEKIPTNFVNNIQEALSDEKVKENPSTSDNAPTSPIIGNRRKRYKKKMTNVSCKIEDSRRKSLITIEEEKSNLIKRHSLPITFDVQKENGTKDIHKIDISDNIDEDRLAAILLQDKIINMKKRNKPKPIIGSLLNYRNENKSRRITWKSLSNGEAPSLKSIAEIEQAHLDPKIINVTATNAISYMFHISDIVGKDINHENVVSVNLSENIRLLINENGYATISEFRKAFLACPGVDPALIPIGWIDNHYKLIVWKLASMDRQKFGNALMPRALKVNRLMEELKYRYDREIDRSQRSALRKILEKDETPSKRIVLCVTSITNQSSDNNALVEKNSIQSSVMRKIEVTDGWYTIPITFDIPMLYYISSGKIKEGTKIVTYGAELQGCERGCHPLEKANNVSLKIHTNSTRRARWDTKLGFQRNSEPFPIKLQNIDPHGGTIGKVCVVIARIYPVLYREKLADGQSIYRNARCEEKAAAVFEQECQNKIEVFYAKAEKDFQNITDSQESQGDWADRMNSAFECRQTLANRRVKQEEFKQKLEQQLRADLPPRRQVTPVLKIRVADENTSALVTIWSGNDDVSDSLKEGSCISIYNASASGRRNGELHLSFNNFSIFQTEPKLKISCPVRTYTPIADLQHSNFSPPYNEFDTVGIISSITEAPRGMKNFEVVNIAFPVDDTTSKFLSIYFWQGVSTSGYSNMFVKGSLIACSNLEWRCNSSRGIPAGYYNEKTTFSCNPRQPHFREPFDKLKNQIKNRIEYARNCAAEITEEFEKMSKQMPNIGTPMNKSMYSNSPQTSAMLNRSDIRTPNRSSLIQKRLEMLSRYGEAPPLSPIITNSSSRVKSEFIPLQRTPDSK